MSIINVNPYAIVGEQYGEGLVYIVTNYSGSSIEELVAVVKDYVAGLNYTDGSAAADMEIVSVANNAINSFTNGRCMSLYNGTEKSFVSMLIGPSFTSYLTVDTLPDRIWNVQQEVYESGLSVDSQTPLLLATAIGTVAFGYLLTEINLGAGSDWDGYWSGALVSPKANLPFWNAAAMEGTLIGARSSMRGLIAPTTNIVTVQIVSALTAALTITSAKIIFLLSRRI